MPDKAIGIVGADYCGSTLLNYLWDGLPGVFGAGESHWVVDRPEITCRQCNRMNCMVWKPEIRDILPKALDDGHWWETLREMAGAEIVVSSDKKLVHYEQMGVPSRLVFSFKDPLAQIFSRAAVKSGLTDAAVRAEFDDELLDNAVTWWVDQTENALDWIREYDPDFKVVNMEILAQNPTAHLKAFCKWAGVEYAESALQYWRKRHHYIGGNHALTRLKRSYYFFRRFREDRRWQDSFTEAQVNRINGYEDVKEIKKRLSDLLPNRILR